MGRKSPWGEFLVVRLLHCGEKIAEESTSMLMVIAWCQNTSTTDEIIYPFLANLRAEVRSNNLPCTDPCARQLAVARKLLSETRTTSINKSSFKIQILIPPLLTEFRHRKKLLGLFSRHFPKF